LQLAREIHDGPLQDLYAIYYQLTNPPPILQESALLSQWQHWKDQIAASLLQVTRELKFVGEGLLPPVLASYGLEVAIRSHLQQFKELHPDIQIEMELMPDEKALSQRTRLVLFRIYQHAVSNVIRHAHAKSLRIFFAYDRDQVVLEISDDGDGFEVPKDLNELARSGHSGLYGSVERVRALGGRFHIDSTPGRGTTLQVIIPRVEARHKRSGS
jgi:signal transduction histidine kinase